MLALLALHDLLAFARFALLVLLVFACFCLFALLACGFHVLLLQRVCSTRYFCCVWVPRVAFALLALLCLLCFVFCVKAVRTHDVDVFLFAFFC